MREINKLFNCPNPRMGTTLHSKQTTCCLFYRDIMLIAMTRDDVWHVQHIWTKPKDTNEHRPYPILLGWTRIAPSAAFFRRKIVKDRNKFFILWNDPPQSLTFLYSFIFYSYHMNFPTSIIFKNFHFFLFIKELIKILLLLL